MLVSNILVTFAKNLAILVVNIQNIWQMKNLSKKFFLAPAIWCLRVRGDKEVVSSFKNDVCEILGWSRESWFRIQSKGVVDIGQPQYEAISELMVKYGIDPEKGWGITEA